MSDPPLQPIPVESIQAYFQAIQEQKSTTVTLKLSPALKQRAKACAAYYDLSLHTYLQILLHQFHSFSQLNFDRAAFEEQRIEATRGVPEFPAFDNKHPADQVDVFDESLRDRERVDFFFEEP